MPGVEQRQTGYRFGVYELSTQAGELRKHGTRLKLQDQPLQILALLLERAGEVVTRAEIQKRLWAEDTYVDFDNAINSSIRKLRDALGDSPENPRFVETLARRGYRFIAPVSTLNSQFPSTAEPDPHEAAPPSVSLPQPVTRKTWVMPAVIAGVVLLAVVSVGLWRGLAHRDLGTREAPLPAVPLTGNRGFEMFPAFSPEGTRVAFTWEAPGTKGPALYVKLIGSGDPVRLTNPAGDFAPAWSPDGRSIAFLRARGPLRAAVMLIPAMGGEERQLAEINFETAPILAHWRVFTVSPPFLAWSPDARWLLATEQKAAYETYSIIRISVESGAKRILTSPLPGTGGEGSLAISPDGKKLAFTRTPGLYERDIYTVPLAPDVTLQGKPTRLTFDAREIYGLAWTADGRRLVFSSQRRGRRELWEIEAEPSRAPSRIAAGDDPSDFAVAREGSRLVYAHNTWEWHLWRIALNRKRGVPAEQLLHSTRTEGHAHYSPDGRLIAFESNRSGNDEIWICQADGSRPVQLTAFRNAWAGSPRWSPDGRMLAFDGNAAGKWDIYVIPAQGGQPTRLTNEAGNGVRPSWSHDGKWVYYSSTWTGHREIWKMPAGGGKAVPVTTHGGYVAFESSDGTELYYTKERGLWKMPVKGGAETLVSESLLGNSFSPAKRGLYFLTPASSSETTPRLQFLDFSTRVIHTAATIPIPAGNEISVSPDEQWVLFDKPVPGSSDLMLVENFR